MTTSVINIKDAPDGWASNPDYVYIGRSGMQMSGIWGNPFILYDESQRDYIITEYTHWLYTQPQKYLDKLEQELRDKILVCFCKPKKCHGDVIIHYLSGLWRVNG